MSFRAFFANVLPDLEVAQAADYQGPDDQGSEQGSQTGERCAERDVAKDAERRNIMLQLQVQQPVEQFASELQPSGVGPQPNREGHGFSRAGTGLKRVGGFSP